MKIKDMSPKSTSGGYERVFNDAKMGQLITKVQATVISNGSELERIILNKCNVLSDVDFFIDAVTNGEQESGIYVAPKKILKKSSRTKDLQNIEPDITIFIIKKARECKIIELKEGFMFDTKKVKAEQQNLEKFATIFGSRIPFVTDWYICCFNQNNKAIIKLGLKNEFEEEHILTGQEFCNILGLDYNEIIENRNKDSKENLEYFVSEMLNNPCVRETICRLLNN